MNLSTLDWTFIFGFFAVSLGIGLYAARSSGKSSADFFLSGRNMPWWLLGISMVATTFSADTPNLVTDIVRKHGISGNWTWWAFLLTGMLTVFVFARLWRRSKVLTDLEFYEMRYSGGKAAFLRIFRAFYLGVLFNVVVMATVCLAAIKIGGTLLDLKPIQTLLIASVVTVVYSAFGGLKGIIYTDFFQFILAMVGTIWAAIVIVNLPEIGGLSNLLAHENVIGKLNILPDFRDTSTLVPLLIVPLAVQWWASYYPGAEPGGGGYIAQRMLSAKDEKNAMGATLFFNFAHYALRPWPWILIALASLIVFPDLASLSAAFPNLDANVINDDLAYPAMLSYLPHGLLGLVIASLIAAFMSTISTHLNWGSSYIANDIYKRFIKPEATEKDLVLLGRISTVVLMIFAGMLALELQNALEAFNIILLIGAGTGLIYILRWFWWRINAYSEISAMIISFAVALFFRIVDLGLPGHVELLIGVAVTTAGWLIVTFLTAPTDHQKLVSFYKLIKPASVGWKTVINKAIADGEMEENQVEEGQLPLEILSMFVGCITVYCALFATGYWIYGNMLPAVLCTVVAIAGTIFLIRTWGKLREVKLN
jgi:solute:Na+ symporter, SSS family